MDMGSLIYLIIVTLIFIVILKVFFNFQFKNMKSKSSIKTFQNKKEQDNSDINSDPNVVDASEVYDSNDD